MSRKHIRPFVQSLHSNVKSPLPHGDAWTIELGAKTLLYGSNTSHKSAVIQSVELALSGSADDIVGRNDVSDSALLMTMSNGNSLGVSARITNGEAALFNIETLKGKVKKPTHQGPGAASLCYRDVREALAGSASTARKAFLGWCASDVRREDVLAHLPSMLHGRYMDVADHLGRGKDPVETLLAVTEYAGKKSRETSREIKGAQAIVESVGANCDERPSEAAKVQGKLNYDLARATLEAALKVENNPGLTPAEHKKQLAEAETAIDLWHDQVKAHAITLKAAEEGVSQRPDHLDIATQLLTWATDNNVDTCPACSSAVGADHITQCATFYADQVAAWATSNQDALDTITEAKADVAASEDNLKQWWSVHKQLEATPPTEATTTVSADEARVNLDKTLRELTSLNVSASQWEQLVAAKEQLVSLELSSERYKDLKKHCELTVKSLLAEQSDLFSAKVNNYLPDAWSFGVLLSRAGRDVFQMGILRDGILHCALSGVEWATLVTAISAAVADGIRKTTPIVLIPEDRAWDSKTIASAIRAFSNFDGQVIMASTVRPSGRIPKDWTFIDMDKVTAGWLGASSDADPGDVDVDVDVQEEDEVVETEQRVEGQSAALLSQMGYEETDVARIKKSAAASIIRDGLSPDRVVVRRDGTITAPKEGKVLLMSMPLPPPPRCK